MKARCWFTFFGQLLFLLPAFGQTLQTQVIATGFQQPLFVCAPTGDTSRLFVVEAKTGQIRIVKNMSVLATPFLDVSAKILNADTEQGLLGMAFHPTYSSNGFFYINYTAPGGGAAGHTVVERYTVSANPDIADSSSGSIIFTIDQPFNNHNGGMIAFGPNDGYLYVGMGDGGSGGDPGNRAQNLTDPLGKILRIDVDSGSPYAIPPSNPYASDPINDKRIWSFGLRNPWRFSFDRVTGDLFIGDVGQTSREELDFQPAASAGNENYGWRIAEGFACTGGSGTCGANPGFTPPIYDYDRSVGQAVAGGYVYRGTAIPELTGTYFFGDIQSERIWSFRYDGSISDFTERTMQLDPGGSILGLVSFGEDGLGELYMTDYGHGRVLKIVAVPVPMIGLRPVGLLVLAMLLLSLAQRKLRQQMELKRV